MAHTIQELVNAVSAQQTVIDGVKTLLEDLKARLLAAGVNEALIDQAFTEVTDNNQELADAITANTPAAPAPGGESPETDEAPATEN